MPAINKDMVTLFLEVFLFETPDLRNDYDTLTMLREYCSYWSFNRTIEFHLVEMEWEDFETISYALIQFYYHDREFFIMDVNVKRDEQNIMIYLTTDAYDVLMSKLISLF